MLIERMINELNADEKSGYITTGDITVADARREKDKKQKEEEDKRHKLPGDKLDVKKWVDWVMNTEKLSDADKNNKIAKYLMIYKNYIYKPFKRGNIVDSSKVDSVLNAMIEEYKNYSNKNGIGEILRRWNIATKDDLTKATHQWMKSSKSGKEEPKEKESREEEPKEKKSKEEKQNVDTSKNEKLSKELADGLTAMGFDSKMASETAKYLTKQYGSENEGELLGVAVQIFSGAKTVKINGKEYDAKKIYNTVRDIKESLLNEVDEGKALKNIELLYKKLKKKFSKKDNKESKDKTQVIIKKKIETLVNLYNKSKNKQAFNDKVNQALKLIGLTNSNKYNATKLLNWLAVAKKSMLKVESVEDVFDLELYKEEVVDIMWKNKYIL
jgi:hypothetical protein